MFSNNLRRGKTLIYSPSLHGLASKYFHEKGFLKIHNLLILFQVAAAVSCFHIRPWLPLSHAVDFLGADQAVCKQGRKNEGSACSIISRNPEKYGLWFTALTILPTQYQFLYFYSVQSRDLKLPPL